MSDSESDGGDLYQSVFSNHKRKRNDDIKSARQTSLLEDALRDADHFALSQAKIHQIKRELEHDSDDDDAFQHKEFAPKTKLNVVDTMVGIKQEDHELGRNRQIELAEASDTHGSDCLGLRHTIYFDSSQAKGMVKFYISSQESILDLGKILDNIGKLEIATFEGQGTPLKPLRRQIQLGRLDWSPHMKGLVRRLVDNNIDELNIEILNWLYQTACSAGLGDVKLKRLASCACTTLASLQQSCSTLETFCATIWCWVASGKAPIPTASISVPHESKRNLEGLLFLLRIWSSAKYFNTTETEISIIDDCLVALSRIALDHACGSRVENPTLLGHIHKVVASLIELASKHADGDIDLLERWMTNCSKKVLEGMARLGPGEPFSADEDDQAAWYCHSALFERLLNLENPRSCIPNLLLCKFQELLALEALQLCLGVSDSKKYIRNKLNEAGIEALGDTSKSSNEWLACAALSVILLHISSQSGDSLLGPLCFASLQVALIAMQASIVCLIVPSISPQTEYANAQAQLLLQVLQLTKAACDGASRRLANLRMDTHFSRARYLLMHIRVFTDASRSLICQIAGVDDLGDDEVEPCLVQQTIDSMWRKKPRVNAS